MILTFSSKSPQEFLWAADTVTCSEWVSGKLYALFENHNQKLMDDKSQQQQHYLVYGSSREIQHITSFKSNV